LILDFRPVLATRCCCCFPFVPFGSYLTLPSCLPRSSETSLHTGQACGKACTLTGQPSFSRKEEPACLFLPTPPLFALSLSTLILPSFPLPLPPCHPLLPFSPKPSPSRSSIASSSNLPPSQLWRHGVSSRWEVSQSLLLSFTSTSRSFIPRTSGGY